ncbi:protease family m14 carboxypeptidase ab [Holotrichia oblita]|uniref:Protease family m14 carboxypeptidase ab n=1 Tax=Holotrichia oblita TaxID=644536 RepID=A0ACB9SRH4_HOLOL|nr:protease family m14 carboxypeptidase ab [Holotrichia oblita]
MKTACSLVLLTVIVLFVDVLTHPTVETFDSEKSVAKEVSNDKKDIYEFGVKIGSLKETDETEEKKSYKGYQLWKLNLDSQNKSKVVITLKNNNVLSTWGGNRTSIDVLISRPNLRTVQRRLDENLINYKVLIDDVQEAIDDENPPLNPEEDEELANRQGHRMTFDSYHRLSDIHGFLDYLAVTYPTYCKVYVIGSSVQGRPLKVLRISNGNSGNKAVWVDGGMHAREWITPASVSYIINHMAHNYDSETHAIRSLDWYFLPVANPDGYEYAHTTDRLWRKNRARGGYCTGTDLNRNYGYRWGGAGGGKNPCQETYAGTGPFSEPETAAIKDFLQRTSQQWRASISYHSYGQYILYPWGYDRKVPPDWTDLQKVAEQAATAMRQATGQYYTVGAAANTLYPASGGSDDWAKGTMKMKYTYTIELRDNGRYGFVLPASYIVPTAKEALAALRVIGEAAAAT